MHIQYIYIQYITYQQKRNQHTNDEFQQNTNTQIRN